MLALPVQSAASGREQTNAPLTLLFSYLVGSTSLLMIVVALVMAARRASGAFVQPLQFLPLLVTALTLAAFAGAARYFVYGAKNRSSARWKQVATWCPMIFIVLMAVTISLPGTSWIGLMTLWCILGLEEVISITAIRRPWRTSGNDSEPSTRRLLSENPDSSLAGPSIDGEASTSGDMRIPKNVGHQLTYAQDETGDEVVYGQVRGRFSRGQRNTSVHIAFCPSFGHVPELMLGQVEGPPVDVKPSQVLPYGLKLDLKLQKAAQRPESVVVEFHARAASEETPLQE